MSVDQKSMPVTQTMQAHARVLVDTLDTLRPTHPIVKRLSSDTQHTMSSLRERVPMLKAIADGSKPSLNEKELNFLVARLTHRVDRLAFGLNKELDTQKYEAGNTVPVEQWAEFRDKVAPLLIATQSLLKQTSMGALNAGIELYDYRESIVAEGHHLLQDAMATLGKQELSVLREFEMMEAPLKAFEDLHAMFGKLAEGKELSHEENGRMQEISDKKTLESFVRIIYDLVDQIDESKPISAEFSRLHHDAHFMVNPVISVMHDYLDDLQHDQAPEGAWTQSLASGDKDAPHRPKTR